MFGKAIIGKMFLQDGQRKGKINFSMHTRRSSRIGWSGSHVQLQQEMLQLEFLLEEFCKSSGGVYVMDKN